MRFGALFLAGCCVAATLTAVPAMAASQISKEIVDIAVKGCVSNKNLVWATPGSAGSLCPCFVQNVLEMRLTDAQRLRVLQTVSGSVMDPYQRPLGPEGREEAFKAGMQVQKGCYPQ